MKEIYFIRHGETEYNLLGIVQGSGIDASLNDKGRAQAKAFYEAYQHVPFEVVLASKLKRTQETVQLFVENNIPMETFHEINEMSWGIHEGKKGNLKMKEDYQAMVAAWRNEVYDYKIEGGESAAELAQRLERFKAHLKTREEKTILVCSHGRAMCCMMAVLRNQPYKEMEQYKHSNTGLYKVLFDGERFLLEVLNDTSHLA